MYLDFFGFQEEPFNITPNSKFLFLSQRHREALAALVYGIEQRKGFIALTGEIGCGKTTICRAMLGRLDREKVRLALILNPELSDVELLQTINQEFGIAATSSSKRELLAELNRFLLREFAEDRNVVLVIDEAQRLGPQALEQVRLLGNLETESAKLLQIALVGQPELGDLLALPELEQLNQRITVRCHITPLDADEVSEYVAHRLAIASPRAPVRFHKKALRRVFEFSSGVPRRINAVCDRALLVAFTQEAQEVSEEAVQRAVTELGGLPGKAKRRAAEATSSASALPAAPVVLGHAGSGAPERGAHPLLIPGALLLGLLAIAGSIAWIGGGRSSSGRSELPPLAPTPTALPAATAATVVPSATPSPALSPTASPTLTASATASATPSATPSASSSPSPTASPSQSPTAVPSATPFPPTATPAPTATVLVTTAVPPTVVPTTIGVAAPVLPWAYDGDGVLRVEEKGAAWPASVITWLRARRGTVFPDSELAALRGRSPAELASLQLTTGRAPLYLRQASLPVDLSLLTPEDFPALVQTDSGSPGFGPWTVVLSLGPQGATLLDPRAGRLLVPTATLEEHLASVLVLYFDPGSITGLKPGDAGDRVGALQQALRRAGIYLIEDTRVFDDFTAACVTRYAQKKGITFGGEVTPLLAHRLLSEPVP